MRARALVVLLTVVGVLSIGSFTGIAAAATPAKTDILLLFDTTGSMSGALDSAKAQIVDMTAGIDARLPDVSYGVSSVRDYDAYSSGDEAYTVVQPITADRGSVEGAIDSLFADGGGDNPEAYGGALLSADLGTGGMGWRPGARRLVVLIADDMPHDDDLNVGIPAEMQITESPFHTGIDPGLDGEFDTSDDVDWQPLLTKLVHDGLPLMFVLFEGDESYLPYWQIWAGQTGGAASDATDADLSVTVVNLAEAGATGALPPCPAGQGRNPDGVCAAIENPAPAVIPSAWQVVRDGYNTAQPCEGDEADVKGGWRTLGKALLCVGSGKVFFDSTLKGKALCVINIGADIVPITKLKALGKTAKVFADQAKLTVKELKAMKLSKAERELVDEIDHAGNLYRAISSGSISGAAEEAVHVLLTSRTAALKLEHLLHTNANLKAVKLLRKTQDAASDLFTTLTGIADIEACRKAFA